MHPRSTAFLFAALLPTLASIALAASPAEDEAAARAAKVSFIDALKAAMAKHPGAILREAKIDTGPHGIAYEIDLFTKDTQFELELHAAHGKILEADSDAIGPGETAEFARFADAVTSGRVDVIKALEVAQNYLPAAATTEIDLAPDDDGLLILEVDLVENGKRTRIDVDAKALKILKAGGKPPIAGAQLRGDSIIFNFDQDETGSLPKGWTTDVQAGAGRKTEADPFAVWAVTQDATAPTPKNILSLTAASGGTGENRASPISAPLTTGTIELKVRMDSTDGERILALRLSEVERSDIVLLLGFDAAKKKARLWSAHADQLEILAEADTSLTPGVWHTVRIELHADRVRCLLDGTGLLDAKFEVKTPRHLTLRTGSTTSASFDSVTITPKTEPSPTATPAKP